MDPRSPVPWLAAAALAALLVYTPTAMASGHGDLPPILPQDLRADPAMENVSADTEEMAFTIQLMKVREYTGDVRVDLRIGGDHVAEINEVWPPDTSTMNVTTDEDADEGPGYWEPTVGLHAFNLTVEAEAKSFPLDFDLPMGPDPSLAETNKMANESPRIRMEPASPEPGDAVTFHVNVTNQGSWATPGDPPVPVRLSLDGEPVAKATLGPLAPYNDTTVTFEDAWEAEDGHHQVSATVDPDAIEEVRTDNNEHNVSFTVAETGLRATNLTADPDPAETGATVTVTATVVNRGEEAVGDSLTGLYLDGEHVAQADTPALDPGDNATVEWTIQPPAGVHELTALANAEDPPASPPPGPVTARGALVVGPDLVVRATNTTPERPTEGDEVTVTGTILNRGAPFEGSVAVDLLLQDAETPEARTTVNASEIGEGQRFSLTFTPDAGEHVVFVRVDPDDAHEEAVDDNNKAHVSISVRQSAPDIEVLALDFARAPESGQPVPVNLTVANHGDDPAEDLVAHVSVNGSRLGGPISLPSIAPGGNVTVQTRAWTPHPGVHTLEASVGNPQDLAIGRPVASETATAAVDAPDLSLEILALEPRPAAPQAGEEVRLAVEVANTGEVAVPAFDVRFAVDGEGIGTRQIDGLEPGQRATIESPNWTLDPDARQASAHLDPDNELFADGSAPSLTTELGGQADAPAPGLAGLLGALAGAGLARARASRGR